MRPVGEASASGSTQEDYREFAERQAYDSPTFERWAAGVAADPELVARLEELPARKRQPNLVFAAARWHGAEPGDVGSLRSLLLDRWDEVRRTISTRATQTNEPGRCATLLPVLAGLPGPLALLELGASAGLNLLADRYSYRWSGPGGEVALDPGSGPSPVLLPCTVEGDPPLPRAMPEVVWRAGIDLNPLDPADADAAAWLATLVWPEHRDRHQRLVAALALAAEDPPRVVRGDLFKQLPALVSEVPRDATLVVFHSAVAAYLSPADRERLAGTMAALRGHWISNEGPSVLPDLLPSEPPPWTGSAVSGAVFVMALDGQPVAWTHGHGRALRWLSTPASP